MSANITNDSKEEPLVVITDIIDKIISHIIKEEDKATPEITSSPIISSQIQIQHENEGQQPLNSIQIYTNNNTDDEEEEDDEDVDIIDIEITENTNITKEIKQKSSKTSSIPDNYYSTMNNIEEEVSKDKEYNNAMNNCFNDNGVLYNAQAPRWKYYPIVDGPVFNVQNAINFWAFEEDNDVLYHQNDIIEESKNNKLMTDEQYLQQIFKNITSFVFI